MYIEHPYFYEGKYYANIDGEMIEITKEVAYAMNNFYRMIIPGLFEPPVRTLRATIPENESHIFR